MSETILSFNVTNLITVTLMAVIGFAIVRVVSTYLGSQSG
jgi:hypothetical protein